MMTETEIPDWVLIEAAKRSNFTSSCIVKHRSTYAYGGIFAALCDTILKHEEPPVDPLLLRAREIWASEYERHRTNGDTYLSSQIRDGKEDSAFAMKMLLRALREGIELGKGEPL